MANISAAQVKALRDKTDISMADCKKALVEAGGDENQALEILKKKYADQMEGRSHKEAGNGRIGAFTNGQCGALIELRCETDFVANSEAFIETANALAALVVQSGETDINKILETKDANEKSGKELIADAYGKLKENINLSRASKIDQGVGCYVHHNGRVGTVVAADGSGDQIAKHICMHVAAQQVLTGLRREDVAPDEVEQARARMMEQAQGKPPEIAEKIVNGKMNKWYGERVLLEQPFAMDDKKTVQNVADEAGINLSGYIKMEVGQE